MTKELLCRREPFGYLFYDKLTDNLYIFKTEKILNFDDDLVLELNGSQKIFKGNDVKLLPSKINRKDILTAPTHVDLYPTLLCNERCEFCYIGDKLNNNIKGLERKDGVKIFNDLANNGVFGVSVLGGEPFLYKDLGWLLDTLNDYDFLISMSTNGTVYNKEIIKKVLDYKISFTLSFHSHLKSIHNNIVKNKIAFDKELFMLHKVLEDGIKVHITMLVTKSNYATLLESVEFLLNEGVKKITLFHWSSSGFAVNNIEEGIDFWDYKKIFYDAYLIGKKYNAEITSRTNFPFLVYEDISIVDDQEISKFLYGSIDSRRVLNILYDGSVYSTMYNLPNNMAYIGNILNEDINSIWIGSKNLNYLRESKLPKICQDCKHFNYCRGGSVLNYIKTYNSIPLCPLHKKPLFAE